MRIGEHSWWQADMAVTCTPVIAGSETDQPVLIVEVLSEGTEKFDRGEKWEGYRTIASLRHYIMVSSEHRLVEHYARGDGEAWILRAYGEGGEVRVSGPDLTLPVEALYRMAFEDDPAG